MNANQPFEPDDQTAVRSVYRQALETRDPQSALEAALQFYRAAHPHVGAEAAVFEVLGLLIDSGGDSGGILATEHDACRIIQPAPSL